MQRLTQSNLFKPLRAVLMIVFFPVTIYYLAGIYLYKFLGIIVFLNKTMYGFIRNHDQQDNPNQIVIPNLYLKPNFFLVLAFPLAVPCLFIYLFVQFISLFLFFVVVLFVGSFVVAIQFIVSLFLNIWNKFLQGFLLVKKILVGAVVAIKNIFIGTILNTIAAIKFVFIEIWRGVGGD